MTGAYRFAVIAGVLAAVICGSAPEVAAQQQPVLACVKNGTGMLRIPPAGEGCKAQETPMSFGDFPLLVLLRDQVLQLQADVLALQERLAAVEACTSTIPECSAE
jgi:hypothetical protein